MYSLYKDSFTQSINSLKMRRFVEKKKEIAKNSGKNIHKQTPGSGAISFIICLFTVFRKLTSVTKYSRRLCYIKDGDKVFGNH